MGDTNETTKDKTGKVKWAKKGLPVGYSRDTYIVNEDQAQQIRDIAYWERISIQDVVHQAFEARILLYEEKNGNLKPRK